MQATRHHLLIIQGKSLEKRIVFPADWAEDITLGDIFRCTLRTDWDKTKPIVLEIACLPVRISATVQYVQMSLTAVQTAALEATALYKQLPLLEDRKIDLEAFQAIKPDAKVLAGSLVYEMEWFRASNSLTYPIMWGSAPVIAEAVA